MDQPTDRDRRAIHVGKHDVGESGATIETEVCIDTGRAPVVAVVTVACLAMVHESVGVTTVWSHVEFTGEQNVR